MMTTLFPGARSAVASASPLRSVGWPPAFRTASAADSSKDTHRVIAQSSQKLLLRCLGQTAVDRLLRHPLPSARLRGAIMSVPKNISRRDFAVSAALATAAIAAVPADLLAQEKPAAEAAKPETPQPPKLSAASQAEVEERYAAILRKYGSRLSEEQKKDVHKSLISQQQGLDQIRAFPLENSDEPATVFNPVFTNKGGK